MRNPNQNEGPRQSQAASLQRQIEGLLDGWARRYAVPPAHHRNCKRLLRRPLYRIFTALPRRERPAWLTELACREKDSFSYALNAAETAYSTLTETMRHLDAARAVGAPVRNGPKNPQPPAGALEDLAADLRHGRTEFNRELGKRRHGKNHL